MLTRVWHRGTETRNRNLEMHEAMERSKEATFGISVKAILSQLFVLNMTPKINILITSVIY